MRITDRFMAYTLGGLGVAAAVVVGALIVQPGQAADPKPAPSTVAPVIVTETVTAQPPAPAAAPVEAASSSAPDPVVSTVAQPVTAPTVAAVTETPTEQAPAPSHTQGEGIVEGPSASPGAERAPAAPPLILPTEKPNGQ